MFTTMCSDHRQVLVRGRRAAPVTDGVEAGASLVIQLESDGQIATAASDVGKGRLHMGDRSGIVDILQISSASGRARSPVVVIEVLQGDREVTQRSGLSATAADRLLAASSCRLICADSS